MALEASPFIRNAAELGSPTEECSLEAVHGVIGGSEMQVGLVFPWTTYPTAQKEQKICISQRLKRCDKFESFTTQADTGDQEIQGGTWIG